MKASPKYKHPHVKSGSNGGNLDDYEFDAGWSGGTEQHACAEAEC